MALAKSSVSHVTGQATSATTTATDISASYRSTIGVSIVQVGTATTASTFRVQVSQDAGTTYYDWTGDIAAGTAAATYTWEVELPDAATNVRLVYVQQVGGTSSTLAAIVGKVTTL